jgi:protein arginine kinase activator
VLYCQRCKKQAATVHLTEIVKGEKRESHLCDGCAHSEGVTAPKPLPVNQIISALVMQKAGAVELANLTCPHCKLTFVEFRNTGLLGCPHDYDVFEKALVPLIERSHEGASHHVGKIPRRLDAPRPAPQIDLIKLREELNKAVLQEQYEKAARIRDKIKNLESE